jgi:hypothetical protein
MHEGRAFELLLSIEVEHDFFSRPGELDTWFAPDDGMKRLLDGCGCIVRREGNGFFVHGDARARAAMAQRLEADTELRQFHVRARVADAQFRNYTGRLAPPSAGLPCLRTALAQEPDASGRRRLHRDDCVSRDDTIGFDAEPLRTLMSARERMHPPTFVVSVDRADLLAVHATRTPGRHVLRFASRATVWHYIFAGEVFAGDEAEELQIVDLDKSVSFEPPRRESNAKPPAVRVQSTAPIALKDRHAGRFQLRQGRGDSQRVLIPRLPLASASHFGSETSGSTSNLISEIYVNR